MVTHITNENFESEVTKHKGAVVVDFWAEWCGPCKRYGPTFEEVSKEMTGKVKFVKVNVEEAEAVAATFGIQSIPTTMIFKDGKPVFQTAGALPKEMLKQVIAQHA